MDSDDEIRRDIKEIKSDIFALRTDFENLVKTLKTQLPVIDENNIVFANAASKAEIDTSQSITLVDNSVELVSEVSEKKCNKVEINASIENQLLINELRNSGDTPVVASTISLIDYSNIKNSALKAIGAEYGEKLYKHREKKLFVEFCYFIVGLLEETIRVFVRKKFNELQEEENKDLLEACSLLEVNYLQRNWNMPKNLYVSRSTIKKWGQYQQSLAPEDNYYFDADKGEYFSLIELEKGKISFTLELCFVLLLKQEFYKQKSSFSVAEYEKRSRNRKQSYSPATQRQPFSSPSISKSLKTEYYYRLDNTRQFRNIYEHNKSDKNTQEKRINEFKPYVKIDRDNYDGILEAARWLISQIDSAF